MMANDDSTQGTIAPAEPTPAAPVEPVGAPAGAQAPATPAHEPVVERNQAPDWLPARLESAKNAARNELLKELGAATPEEAKAALEAQRAAADAHKTLEQRIAERDAALKAEQERSAAFLQAIKQRADIELGSLTDTQRNAVLGIAGDDHAARLRTIDALRPTWGSAVVPQAQVTTAVAFTQPVSQQTHAQPAAQIQTAPAPSAPSPAGSSGEIDHRSRYEELEKNPFLKARYGVLHASEVYRPRD